MKKIVITLALFLSTQAHADRTFSQALDEMIDKNVDVQIQQTKLRASDSILDAAWGTFTPQLNLQAMQLNNGGGGSATSTTNTLTAGQIYSANATWNVFRSGSDWAGLKTAQSDHRAQGLNLEQSFLGAETKAASALLDLIQNKLATEAYRRSENSAAHLMEIADLRFKKGLLSREEMDRVALDASNAQARRADSELLFNTSLATVESLLGSHDVQLTWPWEKIFNVQAVQSMLGEVRRATLEDRPDWRAAKAAVMSEDQHSRQLWRGMLPTVDVTFSQSEMVAPHIVQDGWSSVATLTIPLWSGLKDYSAYRVQVESKYAAEARLRQVERDAESTVHAAQENYKLALQQYQVRSKNLDRAKHIMEQDDARFRIGRTDADAINLDLNRVTEAENVAIQGIRHVHQALMDLYHAFGKRVPAP